MHLFSNLGFIFVRSLDEMRSSILYPRLPTNSEQSLTDSVVTEQTANCLFRADEIVERIVKTPNEDELSRLLDDSSKFVRKVTLEKGTRIVQDAQICRRLPINGVDCQNENNVVAVWIEGEALSRASSDIVSKKEKKVAANTFDASRGWWHYYGLRMEQ